MTRAKAKRLVPIMAAYAEGKEIEARINGRDWLSIDEPDFNGTNMEYRIKPEPSKRLMTRNEVLGFVAHNPHIVVRNHGTKWDNAQKWEYNVSSDNYEWASITERGEIGEPHKFEVDDD